jgi:hypothetical protein
MKKRSGRQGIYYGMVVILCGFVSLLICVNGTCLSGSDSSGMSEADKGLVYDFSALIAGVVRTIDDDPAGAVSRVQELFDFNRKAAGHKFATGREFKEDSTFLIIAYIMLIRSYEGMNDCENAVINFNELKKITVKNYFIIDPMNDKVYDPDMDGGQYYLRKLENLHFLGGMLSPIPYSNCIDTGMHREVFGPMYDNPDEDFYNEISRITGDTLFKAKRNPNRAIKWAGNLINYNTGLKGRELKNGKTIKEKSLVLLSAYLTYIRAYAAKGECVTAKSYFDKFIQLEKSDYQIIYPEIYRMFDYPEDGREYEEVKRGLSYTYREYLDFKNVCLTSEELDAIILKRPDANVAE